MAKKPLKIGDRFSYPAGYGYVIDNNKAIVFEPRTGPITYVLEAEIPEGYRFEVNCPKAVNIAMDALDLMIGVKNLLSVEEIRLSEVIGV